MKNNQKTRWTKPIKVGFDFDGVVMYNPLRIFRPVMGFLKLKKNGRAKNLTFFQPQGRLQELFWWFLHQSSIMPAYGHLKIKNLIKAGKIEAQIITGRPLCLRNDLHRKLNLFGMSKYFSDAHFAKNNLQPHIHKERMIRDKKIEYFIEDNWDIVKYLNSTSGLSAKIIWIYNQVDRGIPYKYKFPSLKKALEFIIEERENAKSKNI